MQRKPDGTGCASHNCRSVGSALGLAAGVTRFLGSLLFGVSALDVGVFIAMPFMVMLVAGVASFLPARRAASLDPAITLRED